MITDVVVIVGALLCCLACLSGCWTHWGFGGAYVTWLAIETWRSVDSAWLWATRRPPDRALRRAVSVTCSAPTPGSPGRP